MQGLDGDGQLVFGVDQLGYVAPLTPQRSLQTSCEFNVFGRDSSGNIVLKDLTEKNADLYFKMKEFLLSEEHAYVGVKECTEAFMTDRALFCCESLSLTEHLRDMTSDYGILPLPKYDDEQENYHSQIGTATLMFFVPKTTSEPELTAKVMEVLGFYSSELVVPSYYEVALKDKYARDEDVKYRVDLIRSSAYAALD